MIVIDTEKLPIKVWAGELSEESDADVLAQARNLANHPASRFWIALMPDFHLGYGMPIGGVLAAQDAVVPNAVGVDIGCGMIATRLTQTADMLTRDQLQAWREATHARVPVGFTSHEKAHPLTERLEATEGLPVAAAQQTPRHQIGTLGGGNHFIELQADEDGRLWLMLHSGSRNLGKTICDHYHKTAKGYMQQWFSAIPDLDLSFLPRGCAEYDLYLAEMRYAMAFAEDNRAQMLRETLAALTEVTGWKIDPDLQIETHHNYAEMEHHRGANVLIHRKGAVKAQGMVTIPGSMGTASYIAEGLMCPESFNTCSHGAGRLLGRKQANRTITKDRAVKTMGDVVFGVRDGDFDEMPDAYKDIDAVMAAQAELVRPLHRLRPLAVVKG